MTENSGRDDQTVNVRDDSGSRAEQAASRPKPDMGFAGAPISTTLSDIRARRKRAVREGLDTDFIPANRNLKSEAASPMPETAETDALSLTDENTLVPENPSDPKTANESTKAPTAADKSTEACTPSNDAASFDANKTWVPSATPTVHGQEQPDLPNQSNPGDISEGNFEVTCILPHPLTHQAPVDSNQHTDQPLDVNKTWVPSKTPTQHDFAIEPTVSEETVAAESNQVHETAIPDPGVSPGTLQRPLNSHGNDETENAADSAPSVEGNTADKFKSQPPADLYAKTAVIEQSTGEAATVSDDKGHIGDKAIIGTVSLNRDASDSPATPSDNASSDPVEPETDTGFEKTQVYSRSMGMRGLSEDEYKEWREGVAEQKVSDTVAVDLGHNENSPPTQVSTNQIWTRQFGRGLNENLTIRRRPVAGDYQFKESNSDNDQPDYRVTLKLAEGGMGAIYLATQTSLDRELAIKTLKPMSDHEKTMYSSQGRIRQVENQRREMFLSEALVTANLVHPHIIPIHDLCETNDGLPFYSMKRVHGTPWSERIRDMTLDENLEVLHKVCDAMAYAHHNGVVNRDLKPENIMLGEFGEVLVLDWGLAVPATTADKRRFASPSASYGAGTPAYMSPELWTGPPESIGTWSDIYLLGAILFEAITGSPPHKFPEPDSTAGNSGLWMIIDSVVRKNEIRKTEHEGELMNIAVKAMSAAPGKRHKNVLDFQDAVKTFQKHDQSRHLADRAEDTLVTAKNDGRQNDYQDYQTAAALFEQAFVAWPENDLARHGLRETRLAYASLAHAKGDYDLGLQITEQENGQEFAELRARLTKSRRLRNGLKYATLTALCLIAAVGAISFFQSVQISRQNTEITALYGDKKTLEEDKLRIIEEKSQLEAEKDNLLVEQDVLRKAGQVLTQQKNTLVAEKNSLNSAKDTLIKEVARVENEKAVIQLDVAWLTEQKARAKVELKNTLIAGLIRTADYPAALQQVDELLNDQSVLAALPDGERNQRIKELKARRQQLQRRARQTEAPVQTQVISPTGQTVVWGDSAGQLTVWQTESGLDGLPETPIGTLQLNASVSHVAISGDEESVIAASGRLLYVWTPASSQHEILQGHLAAVTAISLTDNFLLSADASGVIKGWNVQTKRPLWSIQSSTSIRSLALMPKAGIFLYAGSRGGESSDVMAYYLPSDESPANRPKRAGQLRFPRNRNEPPYKIRVSPDEQILLISNSRNGELMALPRIPANTPPQKDLFPFVHAADLHTQNFEGWVSSKHQRPINDIEFSADGRQVVTASDDRTIGVWRVNGSKLNSSADKMLSFQLKMLGHGARVNAAGFLDIAGNKVLSASADRFCRFWDVSNYQQERKAIESAFETEAAEIPISSEASTSRTGRYILTAAKAPQQTDSSPQPSPDADHVVVNAHASVQRGALTAIAISDDGSRIVTGASDGTAVIWNAATGQAIAGGAARGHFVVESASFEEGHDFNVARLRFLPPSGKVLITTGFDGNLCLWNADLNGSGAGAQEVRLPGLGLVNAIATSGDGIYLAASVAAEDLKSRGITKIWKTQDILNIADPMVVMTLQGYHRSEICSISFSADSTMVATGARDGRVAVWRLSDGSILAGGQLHARNTIVSHLEWLPNGDLVSAGFDGRLQLLHPETSQRNLTVIKRFQHDRIPLERLSFAPDRRQFVTISVRTEKSTKATSHELQLWSVETAEPQRTIYPAIVKNQPFNRITAVNWSGDGNRLAAVVNGNLQIFRTSDWRIQSVLDAPGLGISDAVFAPQIPNTTTTTLQNNAQTVEEENNTPADIIATFDGTAAHLWNLNNHSHLADFRPLFAVKSTALSSNTKHPLLLTGDRAIRVFDASEASDHFGQTLSKISEPHKGVVTTLSFAKQNTSHRFVSGGADGTAVLWEWQADSKTATKLRVLQAAGPPVAQASWAPDGKSILLTNRAGGFTIVDVEQPHARLIDLRLKSAENIRLNTGCFSSDGRFIAVAGQIVDTGTSMGWVYEVSAANQPRLHATITGHEAGGIRSVAFLPETPYLITGGTDGAAIIWNWQPERFNEPTLAAYEVYQLLADGEAVAHKATISSVATSANGSIATASEDGTAIIWRNPFQ